MSFLFLGIFLGYLSATITESLGHKYTGHPGPTQRKAYFKYPKFFAAFLKPLYQHLVIHHHKTFRGEFFEQFSDEDEKLRIDSWIAQRFSPEFAALIWKERYNLTLVGIAGTLPFALPFCIGPAIILCSLGKMAFFGSLVLAFSPVWLSKFVHPLIHLPEESANHHPFIQWLMQTNYMRRVFRNHYLHHQHLETNFNLLLGGDYLVFLHRKATAAEEADLQKLLQEFDRRVRLSKKSAKASHASEEEFIEKQKSYISLKNPSNEERFQFQRSLHLGISTARREGWAKILSALANGQRDFGMKIYDTGISIETWADKSEFLLDAYEQVDEDRILYRNTHFESGDFLLTNQSSDSDGLFSTLLEGRINFAHVALYVVLPFNGKKYPAVVEMNELGVRAVPLKAFLSEQFSTYIEVFRHAESLPKETKTRLSQAALEIMGEDHAFDIYQDASQSYYLNCARTTSEIFRRAGMDLNLAGIRYSEKTLANLKILGKEACLGKRMEMPDDFISHSKFQLAGVIDNGCFEDLVARALMRDRIQDIWRSETLNPKKFPLGYHLHRFVINSIQREKKHAPLLHRMIGMPKENFPSGPLVFLSLAGAANDRMEQGVRLLREDLQFHRELIMSLGSWQAIRENIQIKTMVIKASSSFRDLYLPSEMQSEAKHATEKFFRAVVPLHARASRQRIRRSRALQHSQSAIHEAPRYRNWV